MKLHALAWLFATAAMLTASPAPAEPRPKADKTPTTKTGKAATEKPLTGKALDARIQELDGTLEGLRAESAKISGTTNPRRGKKDLEWEYYELKVRMDRLDEAIEQAEENTEDLARYKKAFADKSVITGSDVAGEGAEKAGEAAAKQVLSKGAGRALGLLGIAGDIGEYGGKWLMKQGDEDALEDAVESARVNLLDLYDVSILLSGRINDVIRRMKEMDRIIAELDESYLEYAKLRARKKRDGERATRHAILERETDAAGDREEKKKWNKESARRGISAVGRPNLPTGVKAPSGVSKAPEVPKAPTPIPRGKY